LDVLLLSEALPKGSVVEIIPIAVLLLKDETGTMTKIIAVPQDASLRVIQAVDFTDFLIKYDAAKRIIEEWFTHYRGVHKVISLGWRDQSYALSLAPKF
ncbi:MAG TPA: inorganic diphosphatase, partial [Saprospiraceae bacterium]|nr:inorganic diphosphatase [Saprospiraceae bacterium]